MAGRSSAGGEGRQARAARAGQLHVRGVAENSAGRPRVAERLLVRALQTLDSAGGDDSTGPGAPADAERDGLAIRILVSLAQAHAELHGAEAGMRTLLRGDELATAHGASPMRALIHNQRALLLLRSGRVDEALVEFGAAMSGFDEAAPLERCNLLLNRGVLHMERGALGAARDDLARCAQLAGEAGLPLLRYMATHNLGYLEFLSGNLPLALQVMGDAARIPVDVSHGVVLLDRARVLVEAGLVREADDALAEAGRIFTRDRRAQDLAEVEQARAECALLAGGPAAARRLAVRARERFRRRGNERSWRAAELLVLQADLARGRAGRAAITAAVRLAGQLDASSQGVQSRTARFVAAEALLGSGQVAQARQVVDGARAGLSADPIATRLHAGYLRARLARSAGDARSASRQVRSGLDMLARYQARFGSIDMQTASAIHGRRLAELGVQLALDDGRPARVFAASERGRAVSSRLPAVRPPADERTAELLAALRQAVEALRAAPSDPARQRRRRELERHVIARSWTLAADGAVRRSADAGAVRVAAAATGSTVLSYTRVAGQLHVVVLGERRFTAHPLGAAADVDGLVRRARADLDVLAYERLPAAIRTVATASLSHSLAALDAALLAPLGLDATRLVIVPTGILGALPWGGLPSCRGVPVTVSPSGTAWLSALDGGARRPASLVAIAGPDLARAEHEVRALGGTALTGEAAGRAAASRAMADASIVHVAAHGRHQTDNPLFSSIRLADGPLFAYELDRSAEHVILSACELGLATVRPGDEALGLTSVLLHLGARSVVAGVARVGDAAAAHVMARYHTRLASGADSAAALAGALETGALAPPPFVCFGAQWQAGSR